MSSSTDREQPHPAVPADVLHDLAETVGTEVFAARRLAGGVNEGAVVVELAGAGAAVLKTLPRTRPTLLDETLRAQRIVEHMRGRGYPTPAWLGVGATAAHVWHLMELVDGAPMTALTPSLVEQLTEVVDLQAGQASEPYDHRSYAWRVVTGREPVLDGLSGHSAAVSGLVERVRRVGGGAQPAWESPDMVHADLNPSNVLVRGGRVVAVVDIENAGSGTRASDLTTLLWHTVDASTETRERLWTRILDVVDWDGAVVLASTQILLQLEWRTRLGRPDGVDDVVRRGERTLDELIARR